MNRAGLDRCPRCAAGPVRSFFAGGTRGLGTGAGLGGQCGAGADGAAGTNRRLLRCRRNHGQRLRGGNECGAGSGVPAARTFPSPVLGPPPLQGSPAIRGRSWEGSSPPAEASRETRDGGRWGPSPAGPAWAAGTGSTGNRRDLAPTVPGICSTGNRCHGELPAPRSDSSRYRRHRA